MGNSKNHLQNPKKHSRHKMRVIQQTLSIMSRLSVCKVYAPQDNGKPIALVFEKNQPIKLTESISWAMGEVRADWHIITGVICRNQQGQHYSLFTEFSSEKECTLDQIATKAQSSGLIIFNNNAPNLEKLVPFWLAIPSKKGSPDNFRNYHLDNVRKTLQLGKVLDRIATNFELNVNLKRSSYHSGEWLDIDLDWRFVDIELDEIDKMTDKVLDLMSLGKDGENDLEKLGVRHYCPC